MSNSVNRFRLLIIGKSGCGKTTILSKVCGEDVADRPSTTRGTHDIEKEMLFQINDKLVAHDSEGFEAGQSGEAQVVRDFIERRCKQDKINDQLHMVWYCLEMNSRPIQHAEREFFSIHWHVPVVAIVTKFDVFVQDVLQKLEEAAEEEGIDIDDEAFEDLALQQAKSMFEQYYKAPLMALPYPPSKVLALSKTHKSTPKDSRLGQLIRATIDSLTPRSDATEAPTISDITHNPLANLFAEAQTADISYKLESSLLKGIFENFHNPPPPLPIHRTGLIDIWNTAWSSCPLSLSTLVGVLESHLDTGPRIIGHASAPEYQELTNWHPTQVTSCRAEQMIAETLIIMEQIFLLQINDEARLQKLISWYTEESKTARRLRRNILEEHRSGPDTTFIRRMHYETLHNIILELPVVVPRL